MEKTIVLNSDYTFINTISWQRAVTLVNAGKVEVLKYSDRVARSFKKTIQIPLVIKLMKFIRSVFKKAVPFSKANILARDEFTCRFCGKYGDTIDHLVPKSKGGKSTWMNCVCACAKCNRTKGSKSLTEARMTLLKRPWEPTIAEFIQLKLKKAGLDQLLAELFA